MNQEQLTQEVIALRESEAQKHEQIKEIFRRLDKQDEMLETMRGLAGNVEKIAEGQARIEETVDELKLRPVKRWDSVVGYFISACIAAFVTYLATKVGLK